MGSSGFERFSRICSHVIGHPVFLLTWTAISILWAVVGFFVGFSESYQFLLLNPLTILTFLMLSPLQYSQSRDTHEIKAMLREMVEDISEVDEVKARERAKDDEERP
jgi:low affinity Fe/Cu permease